MCIKTAHSITYLACLPSYVPPTCTCSVLHTLTFMAIVFHQDDKTGETGKDSISSPSLVGP